MDALVTPIITAAHATDAALGSVDGGWAESYRQLYGDGDSDGPGYTDRVLEVVTVLLSNAEWVQLEESTWEGGLDGFCSDAASTAYLPNTTRSLDRSS